MTMDPNEMWKQGDPVGDGDCPLCGNGAHWPKALALGMGSGCPGAPQPLETDEQ